MNTDNVIVETDKFFNMYTPYIMYITIGVFVFLISLTLLVKYTRLFLRFKKIKNKSLTLLVGLPRPIKDRIEYKDKIGHKTKDIQFNKKDKNETI